MTAKKWTEAENKFIKNNYQTMSNKDLAKKFKVTSKAIEGKLRKLKLKRGKGVVKAVKKKEVGPKRKIRLGLHRNIRCRFCLLVDGYAEKEDRCRFCGSNLFRNDVL